MSWPLLALAGIGALVVLLPKKSQGASTTVHAKPGEIWRVEAILNPVPAPGELKSLLSVMTNAGAPVRQTEQRPDGLHVLWDQQIGNQAVTMTYPKRLDIDGASLLMVGAKRVG